MLLLSNVALGADREMISTANRTLTSIRQKKIESKQSLLVLDRICSSKSKVIKLEVEYNELFNARKVSFEKSQAEKLKAERLRKLSKNASHYKRKFAAERYLKKSIAADQSSKLYEKESETFKIKSDLTLKNLLKTRVLIDNLIQTAKHRSEVFFKRSKRAKKQARILEEQASDLINRYNEIKENAKYIRNKREIRLMYIQAKKLKRSAEMKKIESIKMMKASHSYKKLSAQLLSDVKKAKKCGSKPEHKVRRNKEHKHKHHHHHHHE
ncbi:hypothetical protein AKO1_007663 [Acrasis kona]|uniref:Uncharacterized protein n=1 Tax=Acrasis kona TaxID=1008807 RepID=A0AAW2YQK3_9EUKA